MKAILIVVALVGCLPNTEHSTITRERTLEPPQPGGFGGIVITSEAYNDFVVIDATWPRWCTRVLTERIERSTSSTSRTRPAESFTIACPFPARGAALHITLPSGARFEAMTDDRGRFAFLLPAGESLPITVTTDAKPPAITTVEDLAPAAPRPPSSAPPPPPLPAPPPPLPAPPPVDAPGVRTGVAGVGHAAMSCAARLHLDGIARIELAIADSGSITRVDTDRGDPLTSCLRDELANVTFPAGAAHAMTLPLLLKRQP